MKKKAKKKITKKVKLESIRKIKNRLTSIYKKLIRVKFQGEVSSTDRCCFIGCKNEGKYMHVSHVFPVGAYPWMQWDLDNAFVFCYYHHFQWWHKDVMSAYLWAVNQYSDEEIKSLWERSKNKVPLTREWLYDKEAELLSVQNKIKQDKADLLLFHKSCKCL